ncbi:hypothetical protein [Spirosoma fluminis]
MDKLYQHCSSLLVVKHLQSFLAYGLAGGGCVWLWVKAFSYGVNGVNGSISAKRASRFLDSDSRLAVQARLLRIFGVFSISLPLVLMAGSAAFDGCTVVLASVSHYYYTTMGLVFVGVLYTTGLFLFLYKGDNRAEVIAARFAGICISIVAFLPTSKDMYGCCSYTYQPNAVGEELHKAFAAFFLLTMAMLFCLFARSNRSASQQARSRNRLYRTNAATITVIVLAIVAMSKPSWLNQETQQQVLSWMATYKPIFWLEWLALVAVGTSWLIKGQWLLTDPMPQSEYVQSPKTTAAKLSPFASVRF